MKTFFTLILSLIISYTAIAQANLVGVRNSALADTMEIIEWQAGDTVITSSVNVPVDAYLFGSSLFNSFSGNYYLNTITAGQNSLLSYQTTENDWTVLSYPLMSNITEIDMSTGRIYTLNVVDEQILVNQYEIKDGSDSLIGTISEPGIIGLVVDAIGFNSNDGILYYAGPDGSGEYQLFAMNVRENPFAWTKTPITYNAIYYYLNGLNFDNSNNRLFALHNELDSNGVFDKRKLIELNLTNGAVTDIASLEAFPYYQGGSSCFDQFSGHYMFIGIDTLFQASLVMVNTSDSLVTQGWIPDGISEIACDNSLFSQLTYQQTSVKKPLIAPSAIFPNPAADRVNIVINDKGFPGGDYFITETTGKTVLSGQISGSNLTLNISSLKPGIYHLLLRGTGGITETQKIIVN